MENMESFLNSLTSVMPTVLPLSLVSIGIRKALKFMNEILYKEKYEELNKLIQDRIFLKYMNDDLLKTCLYSLKIENKRRLKLKINKFLKFNLFKISD